MTKDITVSAYRAGDREAWNAFNRTARNGHFLFDRDFMEYHADRFADASLVFRSDGAVIGALPANMRETRIQSHAGLTFGGLIVGDARLTGVCAMLDLAADRWRAEGFSELHYKPLPTLYHRRPAQDDLFWLTRRGARLAERNVSTTIALDVRGPVSSRRRRGGGKAAKSGVRFEVSQDWVGYWQVLATVLEARHNTRPVHSLDEITRLATALPHAITLHVAMAGSEIVAGVVLFVDAGVWHAQYIAVGEQGRDMGALDGLFLHLIETAADAGAHYFDFGISTEQGGTVLNTGLLTQKEEFGGSATCYDRYVLDLAATNPVA